MLTPSHVLPTSRFICPTRCDTRPGEFGFFVTVAFAVNFVMVRGRGGTALAVRAWLITRRCACGPSGNGEQGAGFLGVPKAFYESGYILGPALLLFCASVCDYTKNMVLEAMARAEAVTEVRARRSAPSHVQCC